MTTRLCLAFVSAFLSLFLAAAGAEAKVSYGGGGGGASMSRGCLTSSTRALLGRIESKFGTVQIVSTCRPGARIRGTGKVSKHASGHAVDFKVAGGRKNEVVRWLMANHHSGGTMTYAGMNHIHVDVGYRFVSLAGRRVRRA